MLITRQTDYALRIIRALSGGEQMNADTICKMEKLPEHFVYKILKKLQNCGYISIIRGSEGGCKLTADLSTVTLLDILRATGEDICINACTEEGYSCAAREQNGGICTIHNGLCLIQKKLEKELGSHTLSELLSQKT